MVSCHYSNKQWQDYAPRQLALSISTIVYILLPLIGVCVCPGCFSGDALLGIDVQNKCLGVCLLIFNTTFLGLWIWNIVDQHSHLGCTWSVGSFLVYNVIFFVYVLYLCLRWVFRILIYYRDKNRKRFLSWQTVYRLNPLGAAPPRAAYGGNGGSTHLPLATIPPLVEMSS